MVSELHLVKGTFGLSSKPPSVPRDSARGFGARMSHSCGSGTHPARWLIQQQGLSSSAASFNSGDINLGSERMQVSSRRSGATIVQAANLGPCSRSRKRPCLPSLRVSRTCGGSHYLLFAG